MTKMKKEICQQPVALAGSIKYNMPVLEALAEKLRSSKINCVYLAARGTSDHAGTYGKYLIESMIGVPVALAAPSAVTLYGGKLKLENTLVIGISQSGAAADVLEIMKNAKECGAITLTITNTLGSPLAEAADFHLYCNVGLEESVAATKTFGAQLYLMAYVSAMWAGNDAFLKELAGVPALMQSVIDRDGEVAELVKRYRFMTECFMLSRGVNYPLAMEACLKTQETNYVKAKAYPISDFHHGPFAMIEDGTAVFLYMPDGPALNDSIAMIDKLKGADADLCIVSDSEELCKMGNVSFQIPACGGNDAIAAFAYAVFAQLFACELTQVKGRNPDAPRGLKKVTVTK